MAVYEVSSRRPSTADKARVNIISRGKSNRPIVLVLVSYEPVNWILNIPSDITISKVILVSTKYRKNISQFVHSYASLVDRSLTFTITAFVTILRLLTDYKELICA